MADLGIGDVVRWAVPVSGRISKGPFKIIGKSIHWHAASLDGSPLILVGGGVGFGGAFYYVSHTEVVRDEFLTAASMACAGENKDE